MQINPQTSIYLGTMSGTSLDGLDLVAVRFDENHTTDLIASHQSSYPEHIKKMLQEMVIRPETSITQMCEMDTMLGQFYANEINQFIHRYNIPSKQIAALGSHGQTLRHSIEGEFPYSLQIGDPNIIAARTGLTVVADFRRRDIALGGQGAPLAPAFHHYYFRSDAFNRVILNIGGISNITSLPADDSLSVTGFDTGPGNTFLDYLSRKSLDRSYDDKGRFARSGRAHTDLINTLISSESYFSTPLPKSTGTDYFSPHWLQQSGILELKPADSMATVVELVAISISKAIKDLAININECYVCGGGAHNNYLMERLHFHLQDISLQSTSNLGIDPDWVEAMAFAWLAQQTLNRHPGNLPSVTNAQKFTILGAVYY